MRLGGSVEQLRAEVLAQRLATGPVWVWIDGAAGAATQLPILRSVDAVEVTSDRSLPLVIVATSDGLTRLALTDDIGGDAIVAGVRRLWRAARHQSVDHGVWRWLLGHPRAWHAMDRLACTMVRLGEWRSQFARPPSLARTEAHEAEVYSADAVHASYVEALGSGLYEQEDALARAHLRLGDRLLDVGCGTGREAFGFAALGLAVTAIDVCVPAIAVAQREAERRGIGAPTFRCVALGALAEAPGSYDGVYMSSAVYQGIPGRAERIAQLGRFRELVGPGGVVIVAIHVAERWSKLGRLAVDLPRRLAVRLGRTDLGEAGDRWVLEPRPGVPARRSFRHRFFTADEVRAEIAAAGLTEVEEHRGFWVMRAPGARPAAVRARRYRHRQDVVAEVSKDDLVLVQLTGGVVFSLNGTGRAIWDLAGAGASVAEIAERLHRATGVPLEQGRQDATALLDELTRRGLLDVAEGADAADVAERAGTPR